MAQHKAAFETVIAETDTINESVARVPATLAVFQRFGLDTCCGGAHLIRDAAERHGLDLQELLAALNAVQQRKAYDQ